MLAALNTAVWLVDKAATSLPKAATCVELNALICVADKRLTWLPLKAST